MFNLRDADCDNGIKLKLFAFHQIKNSAFVFRGQSFFCVLGKRDGGFVKKCICRIVALGKNSIFVTA